MISEVNTPRVSKKITVKVYDQLDRTDIEILNTSVMARYASFMTFEWHDGTPYAIRYI